MPEAHDTVGLRSPDFFTSAWNPGDSDTFTNIEGKFRHNASYAQDCSQIIVHDQPIDYFSIHPGKQLSIQQGYQLAPPNNQTNDDVGQILTPGLSFLNIDVDPEMYQTCDGPTFYSKLSRAPSMQDIPSFATFLLGPDELAAPLVDPWLAVKLEPWETNIPLENNTKREAAFMHGPVTPSDSPQAETGSVTRCNLITGPESGEFTTRPPPKKRLKQTSVVSSTETPSTSESPAILGKRQRKSKKKPRTREEEEAKRIRFLERNRVAADKCRQNRKKWIDDLQEKCHSFRADNEAKIAALEEMEHELMELKNMLHAHLPDCKDKNILTWADREASKAARPQEIG